MKSKEARPRGDILASGASAERLYKVKIMQRTREECLAEATEHPETFADIYGRFR